MFSNDRLGSLLHTQQCGIKGGLQKISYILIYYLI